jgi:hypothetical protein
MLPIIVAGSRPAVAVLAQSQHFDCNTSVDLHPSITETPRSRVSFASTVLLNPIGSLRPSHAQKPNRHRARGTALRIPSRDFLLWRFSNAGHKPRSSRRRPSRAGIRKPSQTRKSSWPTPTSALPLKADIRRSGWDVRSVPLNEPALRERAARGAEPVAPME